MTHTRAPAGPARPGAGERRLVGLLPSIDDLDAAAMAAAAGRLERLTKPPGSLGRLEELAIQLAGITGRASPRLDRRAIVVAAADHGVARQGVSAYPSDVTAQMVANFLAGGAAIDVLAREIGAELTIVNAGIAGQVPVATSSGVATLATVNLVDRPIGPGTADMTVGPAMTRDDAIRSIELGLDVAADLVATGVDLIGIGEMGIGNTTAASALTAVLTESPVRAVTGRGTGIDQPTYERKVASIEAAIARNTPDPLDPIGSLAAIGGFEIGVLVGLIVGAVAARVPLVLDGFITGSAALVATHLQPRVARRLIAAHRSPEPGHEAILGRLGLRPILDLELRLGEGTGAALAMNVLVAAARLRDEMATFESAAVSGPIDGSGA
jgi:nicotinate-nucleotide--dimethylbenzimidazole phosphoribosyltransferase